MLGSQKTMKMSDKMEGLVFAAVGVALALWVLGRLLAL